MFGAFEQGTAMHWAERTSIQLRRQGGASLSLLRTRSACTRAALSPSANLHRNVERLLEGFILAARDASKFEPGAGVAPLAARPCVELSVPEMGWGAIGIVMWRRVDSSLRWRHSPRKPERIRDGERILRAPPSAGTLASKLPSCRASRVRRWDP